MDTIFQITFWLYIIFLVGVTIYYYREMKKLDAEIEEVKKKHSH